jgi:hypothetical protein
MKLRIPATVFLIALAILSSCQQDDVLSDLELIDQNLQKFVAKEDIRTCSILFLGEEHNIEGPQFVPFEIKDGFIIIQEEPYVQYNLLHLMSYYQYEDDLNLIFSR